jgi:ABC-type glycerol-3-phosphate transport system substrate-binding protein
MPGYTNVTGLIWNKGLLQQAGLAPPAWGWTWSDFLEKASRFAGREGLIPLSFGWYWYGEWLGTAGTHEISADRKRITFDTPEMLEVVQFWLELLKRKIVFHNPDPKVRSGLAEQYRQAKNDTPFEQQGVYRLVTLRQVNAPDFGVVHTPVHPAKKVVHTANGGHNLLVFKDVKPETRAAAARLAMWMNAPYAQSQMVIRGTAVPVSKAAMSDPKLTEFLKTDQHLADFLKLAPYGWRFPSLPSRADITGVLGKAVEAIMYEEIGPKAGLQQAQQEAQVLLDRDVALMR